MHFKSAIVIFFCLSVAQAKPLYVAPGGNDAVTHAGNSSHSPWRTLQKGAASALPGDTVFVMPGTYKDGASNSWKAFNPAHSGTATQPIVFKSYVLHQAILMSRTRNQPAMGINGRSHIVVDGFRVIGGIGLRERSDYGVIRNCDVTAGFIQGGDVSLHWGIYIAGSSHGVVENNHVHSPADFGNKTHNGAAIMVIGVPGACEYNVIRNNEADAGGNNGAKNSWYGAFGQKAGLIYNNTWSQNIAQNAVTGFLGMGSTNNTKYARDNSFHENIIINCRNAFELHHKCHGFLVYNNTAYGGENFMNGGYRSDAYGDNRLLQVWNNIFSSVDPNAAGYLRQGNPASWLFLLTLSDYNNFHAPLLASRYYDRFNIGNLALWRQATGFDSRSISQDPEFVDPANSDFRLQETSGCRVKGINRLALSPGFEGGVPDMGAYPRGDDGTVIGIQTW